MGEPAVYGLRRDGETRLFGDRWGGVFLYRELLWGPEEFEDWASRHEPLDGPIDDFIAAVLVDFDHLRLIWYAENEKLSVARVAHAYQQLLETAWRGFDVQYSLEAFNNATLESTGDDHRIQRLGDERDLQLDHVQPDPRQDERLQSEFVQADPLPDGQPGNEPTENRPPHRSPSQDPFGEDPLSDGRPQTIDEAAWITDDTGFDSAEDPLDDDDGDDDDDSRLNEPLAWVTVIDQQSTVRHRHLVALPHDLLSLKERAIEELLKLPAAELPHESQVTEGLWIDLSQQVAGVWGGLDLKSLAGQQSLAQGPWQLQWAEEGYAQQCQASGTNGIPMSLAEALGKFVPVVLSVKRFDMTQFFDSMGKSLRQGAAKATGCLLGIICFPLLVFGLVSGNWQPVLISIGITVAVFVGGFKLIEWRLRRSFSRALPDLDAEESAPPVAGPLDRELRRSRLEALLARAGLPPLSEIEPYFDKDDLEFLE